jgi:hypothetical protein
MENSKQGVWEMMSEIELMRAIQVKASELGCRLWRNNNGIGWVGPQVRVSHPQMIMMRPGDVLIRNALPLHAGLGVGSSDLIGITDHGSFLACEVKAPKGRPTEGQESFIDMVKRLGGIGVIAKSVEDFTNALK